MKEKPRIGDEYMTYVLIKLDNNKFRWVNIVCEVIQLSNIIIGKWEVEIRCGEKIIRKICGYKKIPPLIYRVESLKHGLKYFNNIIDINKTSNQHDYYKSCSKEEKNYSFNNLNFRCTDNIPLFKKHKDK